MRNARLHIARILTRAFGVWRWLRPSAGLRVLMYHAIGSRIPEDSQGRYSLSPEQFVEQMRWLKASGMPIQRLGVPSDQPSVAVTFDDGYGDNYRVAYPILAELGIPFTIFVTSDFVRSGDPLYLQPEELRMLVADPLVTIGAHGKSHSALSLLDSESLRRELADSRSYLEDIIGESVNTMSYPHGSVSRRVRALVEEAGFQIAACSRAGYNDRRADLLQLSRTDIWSSDTVADFDQKLAGAWDWIRFIESSWESGRVESGIRS